MNCEETQELLEAFHDGELTPETRAMVAAHVKACANCTRDLAQLGALRDAIKSVGRFPVPESLRDNIAKATAAERRAPWRRFGFGALAASHIGVALAGGLITYAVMGETFSRAFEAQDLVAAHVRALMSGALTQVASSDTHTVRPWFAGKLDFAPDARSFEGFPLVGARVDYVGGRNVAALVYTHQKHVIDVFVSPSTSFDDTGLTRSTRNGYTILSWRVGDLRYRAISDLNAQELEALAHQLDAKPAQ